MLSNSNALKLLLDFGQSFLLDQGLFSLKALCGEWLRAQLEQSRLVLLLQNCLKRLTLAFK